MLQFRDEIPAEGVYSAIVSEKAPSTNNRFKYTAKLECVKSDHSFQLINEKIVLYCSDSLANKVIEPGSEIIFKTHLYEITSNKNPGDFDFKHYMRLKGIRYQATVKKDITITDSKRDNLSTIALNIRTKLMRLYREAGIDGDEYAVLGALTLGDKDYISNEVKSYFSSSGAMHVLSVSGLHVGIIFMVLNLLLKPLNKSTKLKIIKVLLLLGSLWIYAFITGLSPSVLRSTSMFSLLVVGENINRKTNTYNTLAVSAFILLLLNPLIIFNVGFQLSYCAVFSIVFFQPRFASLYKPKNKVVKYGWDLFTVSLAAQLGTTPISIYYFNQFPSYFLLSNFIVVPAAAIILYLGMLFFAVSFIPFISGAIAFCLKYITFALNYSVKTIESLPGSVVENIAISLLAVVLLYLLMAFVSSFLLTKRGVYLFSTLTTLILLLSMNIWAEIERNTQQKLIIYNNRTEPLISYIDGSNHYYFTPSDTIGNYTSQMLKNCSRYFRTSAPRCIEKGKGNKFQQQILTIGELQIAINGKKIKKTPNEFTSDILLNPSEMVVAINQSEKFELERKNIQPSFEKKQNENKYYDLKNDGALILFLK
jgi:competence protein ComEC